MTDDPIERIRLHIEKHKAKIQAPFSIAGMTAALDLIRSLREDNHDLARQRDEVHARWLECCSSSVALTHQRDEARQTLSDWTTDVGVRGFARRSELDAAKAEVETLKAEIEHLEACVTIHDRNRKELKAQVERLIAKEGERISKALLKG